jgi:hypothetical protein
MVFFIAAPLNPQGLQFLTNFSGPMVLEKKSFE